MKRVINVFVAVLIVVGPFVFPSEIFAAAAQTWTQLSPSGTLPAARGRHVAVYDPTSNGLLIYGGIPAGCGAPFGDVWRLSNANGLGGTPQWTQVTPTGSQPAARSAMRAVYDATNDRMIMFGGDAATHCVSSTMFNDVWILSGALRGTPAWSKLTTSGATPPGLATPAVAYDGTRNKLIVFAGNTFEGSCGTETNAVYTLSNANGIGGASIWSKLAPSGTPPAKRWHAPGSYDPNTDGFMVFGGGDTCSTNFNDAWVLKNVSSVPQWVQLAPASPPAGRSTHAAVYDQARNEMVVFGGYNVSGIPLNETWVLAGANGVGTSSWTLLSPAAPLPIATGNSAAGYDASTRRLTIFAGEASGGDINDTWVLAPDRGPFTVTSAADMVDALPGDGVCRTAAGVCTLRAAVQEANAFPGADTILFSAALNGTPITLTIASLDISGSLTITGNGVANTIIQGCDVGANPLCVGSNRLFDVRDAAALTMSGVTLRNAPGAINVGTHLPWEAGFAGRAALVLTDAAVLNCSDTGIYSIGDVTIVNSRIADNRAFRGAAILANLGTSLRMENSTISGNHADQAGGAIFTNSGSAVTSARIIGTTFSGNSAVWGGALSLNFGGPYSISNTTFSGNSATSTDPGIGGGAIFADATTVQLASVTFSDNSAASAGGAIHSRSTSTVSVKNTILANSGGGNCLLTRSGTITSQGYNLADDFSCGLVATGDLNGNPRLAPLANNGGPTKTHALIVGSPAIDAGNPAGCTDTAGASLATDQRGGGFPRSVDGNGDNIARCDIGAFEGFVTPTDTTPPVITPTVTPTPNGAGWNRTDVTISWTVTDPESGIASSSGCSATTLTNETAGMSITCSATNKDGKSASQTVVVKIDKTAPTITGSRTPANANGWNKTDVTVSFSCADTLSGVADCSGSVVLQNEGAGQAVSGAATDIAGNSAFTSVGAINIDKTPPVIVTSRTPANANGWNNGDVSVTFNCSDALSGIDVPCITPQVVSAEGAGQSRSATATDKAGNTATATVGNINIDKTPPALTFGAQSPSPNAAGWNNTDVSIPFDASDALSGVASTSAASPLALTAEGSAVSGSVSVTDKAGNTTSLTSPVVKIDKTGPVITFGTASPAANAAGWNNTNVSVPFSVADALSGIASSTPSPLLLTAEGVAVSGTVSATDVAGNSTTLNSAAFKIDKTPPTITGSRSPAANANGWNNSDVTITFSCSDALSGSASCESPSVVSTDGAAQSRTGTAVDVAGNLAAFTVSGINIDKTPPTLTFGAQSPSPNAAGWNNTNVTIAYTVTDNLSGVASTSVPSPLVFNGEGSAMTSSVSVMDRAGNSASFSSPVLKIDKTPPVVTCSATPDILWPPNNKLISIATAVNVSDSLSGPGGFRLVSATNNETGTADIQGFAVGTASTSGQLMATRFGAGSGRIYSLGYAGFDVAGNTSSCTVTVTVPHDQSK